MATRQIIVDDITSQEINGTPIKPTISISVPAEGLSEDVIALLIDANFIREDGAEARYYYVSQMDLGFQSLGILSNILGGNVTGVYESIRPLIKENRTPQNNESDVIRAWAAKNGMPVNNRGRVPAEVVAKYRAATKELSTEEANNSGGRA